MNGHVRQPARCRRRDVTVPPRGDGSLVVVGQLAHHRADALVGEDLEQQHVRDASVEDVGAPDPGAHRVHAALDLRDHPAGDGAVGDQRVELVGGGLADEARRVVDDPPQTLRCR